MYFCGPGQKPHQVLRLLISSSSAIRLASAERGKLFAFDVGSLRSYSQFIHRNLGITRKQRVRTSPAQRVGGAAVLRDQLAGGGLGGGLAGGPFGDQGAGQAVVAGPGGGGDEGQVDDVALRVASADRVGSGPDVDEQVDGPVRPAGGERGEGLEQGQARPARRRPRSSARSGAGSTRSPARSARGLRPGRTPSPHASR